MSKIESKVWPKWHVKIKNDGVIVIMDHEGWETFKRTFYGKDMDIILKVPVKDRSRQEEKYYRAVVVARVAEVMGVARQVAHEFMAKLFLTVEEKSKEGFRYNRVLSTTELSDKRYDEYIFKECVPWAARPTEDEGLSQESGLGLWIPLPNEVDYENL